MNPIPEYLDKYLYPLPGRRMLELGNKKTEDVTYKQYFERQGIDHTSIDWNGQDGALKLDLRKPIDLAPFDIVTNIGTTEHVNEQEPVWRNIHNLTKVGGVIVSHTPIKGGWKKHGIWYPHLSFFQALNDYIIEIYGIEGKEPKQTLNVRLRKIAHNDFVMPDISNFYQNKSGI